jgi:nitrogen regulatory protein PII
MDLHELYVVTLIAEPVLEDHITRDLLAHGATGFTVIEARGKGTRGIRTGDIPGQNVRIETVVTKRVAERILERVQDKWFESYAVIAWAHATKVVRGDKYVADDEA